MKNKTEIDLETNLFEFQNISSIVDVVVAVVVILILESFS